MKDQKPWLDKAGQFKQDAEIRKICQSWSPAVWEEYLKNFESCQKEWLSGDDSLFQDSLATSHIEIYKALLQQEEYPFLKKVVQAALGSLSEKEQVVLEHLFWKGKSQRQTAVDLGVNRKTVTSYRDRALKKLAEFLLQGAISSGVQFLKDSQGSGSKKKTSQKEASLPPLLDHNPIGVEAS